MGIVYEGVRDGSSERVAIKTVSADDRRLLVALRAEVIALRQIRHPSVVSILDEGLSERPPWYAMELVGGPTLAGFNAELWSAFSSTHTGPDASRADALETLTSTSSVGAESGPSDGGKIGPRPPDPQDRHPIAAGQLAKVLKLYRALCAPLAQIHAQGLVHGDLKPNNVLLRPDGVPVIMDFGLASRALGAGGRERIEGFRRQLGTILYVSPEQIRGEFVDARTDLYSLGCMLYESLAGRPPFVEPHALRQHQGEEPLPLSQVVEGVPARAEALVASLLAKRPADRIGHVDDLAAALEQLMDGGAEAPRSAPLPAQRPYLYRPDLVGRAEIAGRLHRLCNDAERGAGAIAALAGESGIGKTFLAAAIGRHATLRGFQVVTGQAFNLIAEAGEPGLHASALHPFRSLFQHVADRCWEGDGDKKLRTTERLLGHRGKVLAPYALSFAELPGQHQYPDVATLPPGGARQRLFVALAEVLANLAREAPHLLILDDLHWADELTLDFLAWLPEDFFADKRLAVLCLHRSETVPEAVARIAGRKDAVSIALPRLDEGAVRLIVEGMLSMQAAPAALVGFAWRQSEGNPFFVSEYLRLAAATGVVQRREGRWVLAEAASLRNLQLPSSIAELVNQRLHGLAAADRDVVEVAAVLGREFDEYTLAAVAGLDEGALASSLRELVARHVIEPVQPGQHRFVHDKLREVAYAGLSPARRVQLHQAVARVLERPGLAESAAILAHHFKLADERARATDYLEQAAAQALARFANSEAGESFRELLDWGVAGDDPAGQTRRARWERGLGDALHALGKLEESRAHLERATDLLGYARPANKGALMASTFKQLGLQVRNRLLPAVVASRDANQRRRSLEASQAYDRLLQIFYYQGLVPEMFGATLMTLNLAEQAGPCPELARAYSIAHAVAGLMPPPMRSLADLYLERANDVLAKAYDPEVDSYLQLLAGVYRSGTAEWKRAKDAFDTGLARAKELAFERRAAEIQLGLANWEFLQGRYSAVLNQVYAEGTSMDSGDAQAQAWQFLLRSQVALAQADSDQALAWAQKAEKLADAKRLERSELIWVYALLAAASLRSDARANAERYVRLALEQIRSGPPVTFYCIESYSLVGHVLAELAETAPADRILRRQAIDGNKEMAKFAGTFPAARPRALLLDGRIAALRGDTGRAQARWRKSLQAAEELQMPPDQAAANWMLGRSFPVGSADRRRLLEEALRRATEIEGWSLADRAEADLQGKDSPLDINRKTKERNHGKEPGKTAGRQNARRAD